MCLGKVLTDGKATGVLNIIERCNDKEVVDETIPTLIIGKKRAEDIYGKEHIKVLDKNIEGLVFWTYAKNERRDDYACSIKEFNDLILNKIKIDVPYKYVNLFRLTRRNLMTFLRYIRSNNIKVVYVYKNIMIYVYTTNGVYGIDLRECEYLGVSFDKVIDIFKKGYNVTLFSTIDFIDDSLREYINENMYLIPYFYYLKQQ